MMLVLVDIWKILKFKFVYNYVYLGKVKSVFFVKDVVFLGFELLSLDCYKV